MLLALFSLPSFQTETESEPPGECAPCGSGESEAIAIQSAKRDLEQAFQLALSLPDCAGADNLQSCRQMESLLSSAFTSLQRLVDASRASESSEGEGCLSCDPRPAVMPLASTLAALGGLLESKEYEEFEPALRKMEETIERWKAYRCCGSRSPGPTVEKARDREADVRAVLLEKCGESFVDNRRGLRQVVRMPGDRQGCFQTRACRKATSYNGQLMQAGFWTYDGEYWYVWAERRTPRGDWVSCNP